MLTREEIDFIEKHYTEWKKMKTSILVLKLIADHRKQIADIAWLEEESKSLKARIKELEAA